MLVIRRKLGERIVIGAGIEVTVASVTGRAVRLAIHAPRGVPVMRGEIFDVIVAANAAAGECAADPPESADVLLSSTPALAV